VTLQSILFSKLMQDIQICLSRIFASDSKESNIHVGLDYLGLIIVAGYPLSDIEVARPNLEYGIFRLTLIVPSKINHSLI
jgi:hypothetical protein